MKIELTAEQLAALKSFLNTFEDAEQLSDKEYVVDLYDIEPPISLDLSLGRNCVYVDGAAVLKFDEEMDGWYIGERIEEPQPVLRALTEAGALGA
ncbi:MAG: hypothetical protein IJO98_04740 [Clostridia bacterium]|nr:hypothetical protein [Clostridia bacterium]